MYLEEVDCSQTYLLIYVEDMLTASENNVTIKNVCEVLKEKFEVKVIGEPNKLISFSIECKEN